MMLIICKGLIGGPYPRWDIIISRSMLVCLTSTAFLNQVSKAIALRCQYALTSFEFQQNGYKLPAQPKEVHTFIAPVTPAAKRDPDPSSCE